MRSPKQHSWFIKCVLPFTFRVGADITVLREQEVDYDSDVPLKIAEVLIRKVPDDQQVIRVTVEAWYFIVNELHCWFYMFVCFVFFKSLIKLCPFSCSSWTYELLSWGTWTRASQLYWVFWHKASLTMDGEERGSTSSDIYMRFKLDARRASALRSSALTVKERWEKNFIQHEGINTIHH